MPTLHLGRADCQCQPLEKTWNILWLICAIHRVLQYPYNLEADWYTNATNWTWWKAFLRLMYTGTTIPLCTCICIHPNYMLYETLQYMGFALSLWLSQVVVFSLKYGFISLQILIMCQTMHVFRQFTRSLALRLGLCQKIFRSLFLQHQRGIQGKYNQWENIIHEIFLNPS